MMITKDMVLEAAGKRGIEENKPLHKAIILEAVESEHPLTKDAAFEFAKAVFELRKSWAKHSPRELARTMRLVQYERATPCPDCGSKLFYVSNDRCIRCRPNPEVNIKKSTLIDARVTAEITAFIRENDRCCVGDIQRGVKANVARIRRLLVAGDGVRWRVAVREKMSKRYTLITAPVVKPSKPRMTESCMKTYGPAFGYDNDAVYQQFIDKNWNDDMLIQAGFLKPTLEMLK